MPLAIVIPPAAAPVPTRAAAVATRYGEASTADTEVDATAPAVTAMPADRTPDLHIGSFSEGRVAATTATPATVAATDVARFRSGEGLRVSRPAAITPVIHPARPLEPATNACWAPRGISEGPKLSAAAAADSAAPAQTVRFRHQNLAGST
jgi:hypothetical protein